MLGDTGHENIDMSTPNTRYVSKNLGIWSSTADVDAFLDACNHDTGYYGATIGSYVTINDGVYNKQWVIAGFDMEHNHRASDRVIKDNGYGICLIPKTSLGNAVWGNSTDKGYNDSDINKTTLPIVANNLKNVLGDHLINRNVLLSSDRDNNYWGSKYTWTTAYCTLMSTGQITGVFASNATKYDDGEANYKLPLFNYELWNFDTWVWLRGLSGGTALFYSGVQGFTTSGDEDFDLCSRSHGLCPLIYIR